MFFDIFGKITPPEPFITKYGDILKTSSANGGLISFLNNLVRLLILIGGLWTFLNIVLAGYGFLSAGEDPKKIEAAWKKIWQSLLGLLVMLGSFVLTSIFSYLLFKNPSLILNPKLYDVDYYTTKNPKELGYLGGEKDSGLGTWSNLYGTTAPEASASVFSDVISNAIGVMTIIAGIWFIFQFISGGYSYMTAGGDQQKVNNASQRITNAIIGLVVVVAAYAIASLIGKILGFNLLNVGKLIKKLGT